MQQPKKSIQNKLKSFVNQVFGRRWLIFLLVFVVVGLLLVQAIALLTPAPEPPPPPPIAQKENPEIKIPQQISGLVYTGPKLDLPKKLPVYQVSNILYSSGEVRAALVDEFGLTAQEGVEEVWASSQYILRKQGSGFNLSSLAPAENFSTIDSDSGVSSASNTIARLFPNSRLLPISNQIEYFRGNLHLTESSPDRAQCIEVPFSYFMKDQYPVYYQSQTSAVAEILLCGHYEIRKLQIDAPLSSFEEVGQHKSLSASEALDRLGQNQQAEIVEAQLKKHGPLNVEQLVSGELAVARLEYRWKEGVNFLYPFYRFQGTVTNHLGEEVRVTMITPAIITQ